MLLIPQGAVTRKKVLFYKFIYSFMKNQKGFIPVIIAVVVLVVVGIVGYVMVAKNKAPGKGVLSNIQLPGGIGLNSNCKLKDPELCKYMDKSIKMADSFKTGFVGVSVTTDKSGKKMENTWEMAGDAAHFVSSENGKELSNMITISNTTYTKDLSDGKWTKFTFNSSSGNGNKGLFNTDEIKKQLKDTIKDTEDKTTYKSLGKEGCGSSQCFKYQIINPLTTDTKEYVYFDDREYVMRKMKIETAGSVTETMFEFKTVQIKEPSPIKESSSTSTFDFNELNKPQDTQGSSVSVDTQKLIEEFQNKQGAGNSSVESSSAGE